MKSLKDILNGKKESKVVPGSTGDDPAVDYAAVSKKERDAVEKHKVEKHEDRVGNEDVPYKATISKAKFARHGKDTIAAGKATYEETSPQASEDKPKSTPSRSKNPNFDPRKDDNNDKFVEEETQLEEAEGKVKKGEYHPTAKEADVFAKSARSLSAVGKGGHIHDFDKHIANMKSGQALRQQISANHGDVPVNQKKIEQNHRKHYAKMHSEEAEQIVELSDNTLKSYKKKATDDMWDKKDEAEDNARRASAKRDTSDVDGYYKHRDAAGRARQKASNRAKGILAASDKLNKEETSKKKLSDILEVSSSTLGNYINKAVDDNKNRKPGISLALKKRNGDPKVKATKVKKED